MPSENFWNSPVKNHSRTHCLDRLCDGMPATRNNNSENRRAHDTRSNDPTVPYIVSLHCSRTDVSAEDWLRVTRRPRSAQSFVYTTFSRKIQTERKPQLTNEVPLRARQPSLLHLDHIRQPSYRVLITETILLAHRLSRYYLSTVYDIIYLSRAGTCWSRDPNLPGTLSSPDRQRCNFRGVHAPRRREWGQGVTSEMVAGSAAKFRKFFWPETFREIFN